MGTSRLPSRLTVPILLLEDSNAFYTADNPTGGYVGRKHADVERVKQSCLFPL